MASICRILAAAGALAAAATSLNAAERFDVGLAGSGTRIEGAFVSSSSSATSATVLIVGGLHGRDTSVAAVQKELARFEKHRRRAIRVLAIPLANPDGARLEFPPSGVAYRENPESHVLWRWIGTHAPDLVLIAGRDEHGLAQALAQNAVAEVGRIPARALVNGELLTLQTIAQSDAAREIERRSARSPRQLAEELARYYGRDFNAPWYINAVALIGRARVGQLDDVKRLAEPYVNGSRNSLERPNSLVLAGHLVFADLAHRTDDPRYVQMVRKIGELGFDSEGGMKASMPYHDEYSDSIFMATPIVAEAGALTGEQKYFDLAARHLAFMQKIVLRPDGLYRHQPLTDAAWGRGNAFAAVGLALTLSRFPQDHPEYERIQRDYRQHMATLARFQDREGLWRNVIDHPGAYPELSATAMIGFAMLRGLRSGWLDEKPYRGAVEKAWRAVLTRTGAEGRMVDVCESTTRMKSLDEYLHRAAILGPDARGGAMSLLFATEMAGLD